MPYKISYQSITCNMCPIAFHVSTCKPPDTLGFQIIMHNVYLKNCMFRPFFKKKKNNNNNKNQKTIYLNQIHSWATNHNVSWSCGWQRPIFSSNDAEWVLNSVSETVADWRLDEIFQNRCVLVHRFGITHRIYTHTCT